MSEAIGVLDGRPGPREIAEYYRGYVERVRGGSLLGTLSTQLEDTFRVVDAIGDPDHRYAPGKWSVMEVLVHMADTERVFGYRALRIGRGDSTPLPGMDQDDYVVSGDLAHRTLTGVKTELRALRDATVALFRGFTDEALLRTGTADGAPFTPRAIAWVIAGHELHHRVILEERYR